MARRRKRRSPESREWAAWGRVFMVLGLLCVGVVVWQLNLPPQAPPPVAQTPLPRSAPTPSLRHTEPKPAAPAPTPPVETIVPPPNPAPVLPPSTPPPTEPPTAAVPEPISTPPPAPPSLTYQPQNPPSPGPASPTYNPTPNTLVRVEGRLEPSLILRHQPNPSQKTIALTFDDGPNPDYTPQVLAILERYKVVATFFWIGRQIQRHPQQATAVIAAGHAVGNHTYTHRSAQSSFQQAQNEIDSTQELIENLTGQPNALFRPPGGRLKNGLAEYALRHGQTVVMWSVQSNDWEAASSQAIVQNVLQAVGPGRIVLLHDGGGDRSKTVEALPQIIEALHAEGYTFVTVPQMLAAMPLQQ